MDMHETQKKLLALAHTHDLGKTPLREIGRLLGDNIHPQIIKHHLRQLEKKGLVSVDRISGSIKRTSMIMRGRSNIVSVPILGAANCGEARMIAEENIKGYIKISASILSKTEGVFALRASGDSMNAATIGKRQSHIEDGDYVIIDSKDKAPQNNSYVLSVIDGMANIKKLILDKGNHQIILLSESKSKKSYPPIFIHEKDNLDYFLCGKIVQVIKYPKGCK